MKLKEHIREGVSNLYYSKLRSLLALLGVLVGTASVVAMVLGGELATNEALREFKSLGTDLLALSINSTTDAAISRVTKPAELSLREALDLVKSDQHILEAAPYTQLYYPIYYEGQAVNGTILGVSHHFAEIIKIKMKMGRFISLLDGYQFYCVIGRDIYRELKKISLQEPLGKPLQIGKNTFVIAGVTEAVPENSFVYATLDSSVYVPLLASTAISQYAVINNVIMRLSPDADIPVVTGHITENIQAILSGKQTSFQSAKELIAKMKKQSQILTVFLGLIGGVSLLVGGIGVMNIMLVSVVERRREIGIRMAVGARRKDIGLLFLTEAVMLSLVGGGAGVVIGIFIAFMIAFIWGWQFTLFLLPPLVGFSVSVLVGIFFGFYPAYTAAKLNPIDALRAE